MKIIDAHVHVFKNLQGFRGEGELYPIGGGKARWANGDIVEMIPHFLQHTTLNWLERYT